MYSIPLLQLTYYIFVCLTQFCASHVGDARCKGLISVHTLNLAVLGLLPIHYPTYFFLEISYIFCLLSNYNFVAMLLICVFISSLSCLNMFRIIADPQPNAFPCTCSWYDGYGAWGFKNLWYLLLKLSQRKARSVLSIAIHTFFYLRYIIVICTSYQKFISY